MTIEIKTALISVFNKEGIVEIAKLLTKKGVRIYSTGGTYSHLKQHGIEAGILEAYTQFPEILGGRVKTLHPKIFGGILAKRTNEKDMQEVFEHGITLFDLVIIDLYPFQKTVCSGASETEIIEKIDIGGPSLIRAAAKNLYYLTVIADIREYGIFTDIYMKGNGSTTLEERRLLAAKAFFRVMEYDTDINHYFSPEPKAKEKMILRYGENPHQKAEFKGNTENYFQQLYGKELSFNNLNDIESALRLMEDVEDSKPFFAIMKHTNVCGAGYGNNVLESYQAAFASDPESAFGGILISNTPIDEATALKISHIFFEVLAAPTFSEKALEILSGKKNRIMLRLKEFGNEKEEEPLTKSLLGGILVQDADKALVSYWQECGGRLSDIREKEDLTLANIIVKHLKSNAIAIVKNGQLIGKGCGQTSRIDALKQALAKARQFDHDLKNAVLGSDAFFPFGDCVQLAHEAGISAFIQPGGSVRDNESIDYCSRHNLAMVFTGMRHFRH